MLRGVNKVSKWVVKYKDMSAGTPPPQAAKKAVASRGNLGINFAKRYKNNETVSRENINKLIDVRGQSYGTINGKHAECSSWPTPTGYCHSQSYARLAFFRLSSLFLLDRRGKAYGSDDN